MALPVAMALSGLPQEQFTGNMLAYFNHGAVLLKSPSSLSTASCSSSASCSSCASSASAGSSSSSASSVASASSKSCASSTLSLASACSSSNCSCPPENENVATPTEIARESLDYYVNVIEKLEERFQSFLESPKRYSKFPAITFPSAAESKIMYKGRDLLDLAGNLKWGWPFQHAVLQDGVNEFFENRSQISRVGGAEIPPHKVEFCENHDCDFQEPKYY